MSRAAAKNAANLASANENSAASAENSASQELGLLEPQAQSLINSQGYDPATLASITNAGMGGVNATFGSAKGDIERQAARTNNPAGVAGAEDKLAMDKGRVGGQEAGDIQMQNADFKNQQRMAGLSLLNNLYGTNVNSGQSYRGLAGGAVQTQAAASPGWIQNLTSIANAGANIFKSVKGGGGGSSGGGGN